MIAPPDRPLFASRSGRLREMFARRRSGVVLPMVLVLSAVVTLTVLVLSVSVTTDLRIARNDLLGRRALAVAEAGFNHAVAAIGATAATEQKLTAELGDAPTGVLAALGSAATRTEDGGTRAYRCTNFAPGSGESPGDAALVERGTYCVRADDNFDEASGVDNPAVDADGAVFIRSRGEVAGAVRVVEGLVALATGARSAMVVNGNLTITGNASITGDQGSVHANGSLLVPGGPSIAGGATSTGSMSLDGIPTLENVKLGSAALQNRYEMERSGQPAIAIPPVRPFQFGTQGIPLHEHVMNDANGYRLDADGNIYVGPGFTGPGGAGSAWSCTESSANCTGGRALTAAEKTAIGLNGWRREVAGGQTPAARWIAESGVPVNGIYLVEGSVIIDRNWGKTGVCPCPWRATIITLNSLEMRSTPRIASYYQSVDPAGPGYVTSASPARQWDLRNLLVVSGNDLAINGTGEVVDFAGGFFAHQQLRLSGNPRIAGFLVGENGGSTWSGDPAPSCASSANLQCDPAVGHSISGNPVIEYNGVGSSVFPAQVMRRAWRDVR